MENETVNLLLQVLQALAVNRHEAWEKFTAMERVLEKHPEIEREYSQELSQIRASRAADMNRQGIEAALSNLRAKLLRS